MFTSSGNDKWCNLLHKTKLYSVSGALHVPQKISEFWLHYICTWSLTMPLSSPNIWKILCQIWGMSCLTWHGHSSFSARRLLRGLGSYVLSMYSDIVSSHILSSFSIPLAVDCRSSVLCCYLKSGKCGAIGVDLCYLQVWCNRCRSIDSARLTSSNMRLAKGQSSM